MAEHHTKKVDGRPSFQFYPDDWMSDAELRMCPSSDRGLWIDMLCIMWKAPRRGYLEANGNPIPPEGLSRIVGEPPSSVKQSLSRMEAAGVYSKADCGTIYCRRMVRDEKQRLSKVEAGRLGGMVKTGSRTPSKTEAKRGSPTPASTSASLPPTPQGDPGGMWGEIMDLCDMEIVNFLKAADPERVANAYRWTKNQQAAGTMRGEFQACMKWATVNGKRVAVEKIKKPCQACIRLPGPEASKCEKCGGQGFTVEVA